MAISDYAIALFALLGTLIVPFIAFYQMLRLRRRAIQLSVARRGDRR